MITFKNLKTGEIKEAFSAREVDGKIHIRFKERGKEYCYSKSNVEIIDGDLCNQQDVSNQEDNKKDIIIYTFEKNAINAVEKRRFLRTLFSTMAQMIIWFSLGIKNDC